MLLLRLPETVIKLKYQLRFWRLFPWCYWHHSICFPSSMAVRPTLQPTNRPIVNKHTLNVVLVALKKQYHIEMALIRRIQLINHRGHWTTEKKKIKLTTDWKSPRFVSFKFHDHCQIEITSWPTIVNTIFCI